MSAAIQKGLGSIISLAGKATDLFNEAATTQTSIIATSGNLMKLTGYNFSQATSFVEDFQSQMSEVAAKLPGMASDFTAFGRGIMDDVIPAFAGLDGKLDSLERRAALGRLKDLTTFGTLLGQTAGIDSTRASSQAAYFLSGTRTLKELKTLDLYEKNTTFRNELERLLGGRDLRRLSSDERQRIFLQAARLDPRVLEELSNSVEGVFGTINDKLFGLQTGLFGLMRDVDPLTNGNQSAFKAINKALLALFGDNGLFSTLGATLKILGVTGSDPMRILRDAANSFAARVRYLNLIFSDFNALKDLGQLQNDIRYFFKRFLNLELLGKKLAEFVSTAFSFLAGSNSPIFYSTLATAIGEGLIGVVKGIGSFLANLDGSVYAAIGAGILLKMGVTALFKVIASRLLTIGAAWFAGRVLPTILAQLAPVLMGIMSGPAGWITLAIAAVGLIVIGILKDPKLRRSITEPIGNFFRFIGEGFSNLWKDVVSLWDNMVSSIKGFFGGIANKFNEFKDWISGSNSESKQPNQAKTGLQNWWDKLTGKTPNSANGLNYQGLLGAAARELNQAPQGSGLVVANTSEAILNRQQQAVLLNGLSSRGGSLNIGSITINTQAKDAEGIAKTVVSYIAREWSNYQKSHLAIAA
ncbi:MULTISPECIES: hypothetical protein [Calothrix]|uniref:Uncharacterized protein n=2 Tax=Calothrix TaxID=1186 RepID=A0ABR8AB02_9CYAN|nr:MULTISPECIES: hypothetical protein [Calothrix]MBD2196615.1 hypothetical protein [Calothrix parietina FACHB-288]MBD2228020.1 hypothetical protein [Calothrix anomala FACHB-343]